MVTTTKKKIKEQRKSKGEKMKHNQRSQFFLGKNIFPKITSHDIVMLIYNHESYIFHIKFTIMC